MLWDAEGLLHEAGYEFVEKLEQADICVVNSCTVKSPSEFALYSAIKAALGVKDGSQTVPSQGRRQKDTASSDKSKSALPCSEGDTAADPESDGPFTEPQNEHHHRQRQHGQQPTRRIPCVVAGCVPGGSDGGRRGAADSAASWQTALLGECSIVGVSSIGRIVEVVEQALQGRIVRLTGGKG